jgi:hypothetical protein
VEWGDSWERWIRSASDAQLAEFAAALTETLPPDDPMIIEIRYGLRRMRDALRREDRPGSTDAG